ncbi:MAG: hypothetical protein JWM53_5134 [bacterium]|nr:hypothetical protein [bacterium]
MKYAAISATAMRGVRGVEIDLAHGNVVRIPWARPYAQIVATKFARDKATLESIRVEVVGEGRLLAIHVGTMVGGVWSGSLGGSTVDLAIYLPARLMNVPPPKPIEPPRPGFAAAIFVDR